MLECCFLEFGEYMFKDSKLCTAIDCGAPAPYYCVDVMGIIRKRCMTHMNHRVDWGEAAFKDLDSARVYITKMRL